MKERIKWVVVGFGFMVGIQIMTSLLFMALMKLVASNPDSIAEQYPGALIFGFTLGAFLVGGFIIGRVEETLRIGDAVIAAVAALALSMIVYLVLPDGNRDQFTGAKWLSEATQVTTWWGLLLALPPLVAAALGAYLGSLMSTPVESAMERFVAILGLIAAFVGPLIAFAIGTVVLPGYASAAGLGVILAGIAVCYWMFARGSHRVEDVSINSDHRHGQPL